MVRGLINEGKTNDEGSLLQIDQAEGEVAVVHAVSLLAGRGCRCLGGEPRGGELRQVGEHLVQAVRGSGVGRTPSDGFLATCQTSARSSPRGESGQG